MRLYRLSLIFILYCGWYNYGVSCAKSNNVKPLTSIKHQTLNLHSHHEDSEQTIRSQRELKKRDFGTDANDLPKQERNTRGVLGSRKHLKPHDANQVANYFISGGPLKGHTHFTRSSNCDTDEDEANVVGMSNPSTDNNVDSATKEENVSTNSSDSIVGAPHIPGLYSIPGITPIVQPPALYKHVGTKLNPLLHPALNTLPAIPHIPLRTSLLRSVLHPSLHPHINKLHSLPSTLMRAASLPVHGLLRAQSELHKVLLPTMPLHQAPLHHTPLHLPLIPPLHRSLVGSTNQLVPHSKVKGHSLSDLMHFTGLQSPLIGAASPSDFNSKIPLSNMVHPNLLAHSQPIGYIVKYVPHSKEAVPLSPVVGSPHQQPSNCINNDLNTEQEAIDAVNNKDEDTNGYQQDGAEDESDTSDN